MGFCVAKYEMKADKDGDGIGDLVSDYPAMTGTYNTWYFSEDSNITLVSTPEGSPIAKIKQTEAIAACESIGGHLITNNEWMTIVRNIELVPSNWSSGVVGDGYLPRGNSSSSSAMDGFNELSGWTKRTLTLTNGEVIWDLVGNVWEWTNDSILQKDQPDGFNDVDDSSYIGDEWFDYSKGGGAGVYITSDNLGDTTLEYKDLFLLTSNKYNANNNGVGRIYIYSNDTSTTPRVFLRGGSWNNGSYSGLLALLLNNASGYLNNYIGLRCAVVP
jgi:formylglycine-generating enzyme required for sulfatase activity